MSEFIIKGKGEDTGRGSKRKYSAANKLAKKVVGAKTPLSAILAAIFLMIIVLLIAPLTAYLPIAAMGGVILLVAYNLIDFHQIKHTFSFSKSETSILLTTFFATLFLELEFAIYLGVILSLVLFLAKTSTPRIPTLSFDGEAGEGNRK